MRVVVTNLRDRRIRDKQLKPRLAERDDAAENHRCGAQASKHLGRGALGYAGHDIEPHPDDQEERKLNDEPR